MNRFCRCTSFLLAVVMLLSFPVCANDGVESRSSSFFVGYNAYLREEDSYNFSVVFRVTGKGIMDEIGAKSIKVQISEDGENWATTQTYTMEAHPEFIAKNDASHTHEFNYNGSKGFYYRAVIKLYAKNSTGTGVYTVYTSKIQLGS